MNREELIDGWEEFLEQFHWNWIGTMSFRQRQISVSGANRNFLRFIEQVKEEEGATDFHWFRVTERGAWGRCLCVHFLVGGLREGETIYWLATLESLSGKCRLDYCYPVTPALRDIVKESNPRSDFSVAYNVDSARRVGPKVLHKTATKSQAGRG